MSILARPFSGLINWVSDHPGIQLCNAKRDYTVTGKLLYQNDGIESDQPMVNYTVKFYVQNQFGLKHCIGTTKTDNKGSFQHNYTWNPSKLSSSAQIPLRSSSKRPSPLSSVFLN